MPENGAYDDLREQVNDLTDEVDLYLGKLSEAESETARLRGVADDAYRSLLAGRTAEAMEYLRGMRAR
jgi:hypothetical protein